MKQKRGGNGYQQKGEKTREKKENMEGNGNERVILVVKESTSYVRREQLIRK